MSEMNDLESRERADAEAVGMDDPRTITRPDPALHIHYLISDFQPWTDSDQHSVIACLTGRF